MAGDLHTLTEPAMPHDLLTIAEASAALRLQTSTLRSWILKRRIAYCKLGSRVFIRRQDIDSLISRSVVPAQTQRYIRENTITARRSSP